jgi:hypothetical protein
VRNGQYQTVQVADLLQARHDVGQVLGPDVQRHHEGVEPMCFEHRIEESGARTWATGCARMAYRWDLPDSCMVLFRRLSILGTRSEELPELSEPRPGAREQPLDGFFGPARCLGHVPDAAVLPIAPQQRHTVRLRQLLQNPLCLRFQSLAVDLLVD